MRSNKLIGGIVVTLSLIQMACGGGGGGNNIGAAPVANDLVGSWRQSCRFNQEDSDYEQDLLVVTNGDFTLTQSTFTDSNCTEKEQESALSGTYSLGEDISVTDGGNARVLDLNLSLISLALFADEIINSANGAALCGITNWSTGTSFDISNCADVDGTDTPRQIFDIFRVTGNQLLIGDEGGDTPADRPQSLDTDAVFIRETAGNMGSVNEDPDMPDTGGDPVIPEGSLALTADNGLSVAQFSIAQYDLIKGLTNAGNTGVISLSGNSSGRLTGLFLNSSCEGGGAAIIDGTPAILSELTVRYSDCLIDGLIYNGNLSLNFVLVNGDLGTTTSDWSFSAMASMNGLNVSSANRSIDLEGEFVLTTVFLADTEIAGGATSRFQGIQGEVITMREPTDISRMIDFDFLFTYRSTSPVLYSDAIDEARIASTIIGGQVSLAQSSGFGGFDFTLPSDGELEVFGADSSMLEIDAEESDTVVISVDADGNGEFTDATDSVISGSWPEFFTP